MTYDPWRDAAERHPGVHIERCDCQPFRGAWIPGEQVILLEQTMLRAERNEVLAHEIAHVDLRHAPTGHGWFDRRQERAADDLAAFRLLSVERIADAIVEGALGADEVSEAIEVPAHVVTRRVRQLTDAEKDYIKRRLAAKGQVA